MRKPFVLLLAFLLVIGPVTGGQGSLLAAEEDPVISPIEAAAPEQALESIALDTSAQSVSVFAEQTAPIAGTSVGVILRVRQANGTTCADFTGSRAVTISGVQSAPDGSYGSLSGVPLSAEATSLGQTIPVTFINGMTGIYLVLNSAAAQTIRFSVAGVALPTATLSINPAAGDPARLALDRDIGAPETYGGYFSPQPVIHVVDAFGNLCTEGSASGGTGGQCFAVTAAKYDQGDWALGEFTSTSVVGPIVPFVGLTASSRQGVAGAQLIFTSPGLLPVVSGMVNIPGCGAVSAGEQHVVALRGDGTLVSWGGNGYGQLGDGTVADHTGPVSVGTLDDMKAVAAGGSHSLAIGAAGAVVSWGNNAYGQLGVGGQTAGQTVPSAVALTGPATAIAAGHSHSVALLSDGTVMTWGDNQFGQLGVGSNAQADLPQLVDTLTSIKAIAAGAGHTVALRQDGTVVAWGRNDHGQLGDGTTEDSNLPVIVPGLAEVTAIAAGDGFTVVRGLDGTVFTWGRNDLGQLGIGNATDSPLPVRVTGLGNVTAIAAGRSHVLAVNSTGTVSSWGDNSAGQLGFGTSQDNALSPLEVSGLSDVWSVSAGGDYSTAMQGTRVISWGANSVGQLGDGTNLPKSSPNPTTVRLADRYCRLFIMPPDDHPNAAGEIVIPITVYNEYNYPNRTVVGDKLVTISGVLPSSNGSYGTLNGVELTSQAATGQTVTANFSRGTARMRLILSRVGTQTVTFSTPGLERPASSVQVRQESSPLPRLKLIQDLLPPPADGTAFARQPVIHLVDASGNIRTSDSSTVVTASPSGSGSWTLTGSRSVTAKSGVVTFTDLGVQGSPGEGIGAISFSAPGFTAVTSSTFTLPAPSLPEGTLTVTAAKATSIVDESLELEFVVRDAQGNIAASCDGVLDLAVSGVSAAPDGSYGLFGDVPLTSSAAEASGQTLPVTFSAGIASQTLRLHAIGVRSLSFRLAGMGLQSILSLDVRPGSAAQLQLTQDIAAPTGNGMYFSSQPRLTIHDRHGNLCWTDNSTQVTAVKHDQGDWSLQGLTTVVSINGRATFDDLKAVNRKAVTGAQLAFSIVDVSGSVISRAVDLLPETLPPNVLVYRPIASGSLHSLAVQNDGKVLAWGANDHGQLGDGSYALSCEPVYVSNLTNIRAVAAGGNHSLALQQNGEMYAWGCNEQGQLGTGSANQHSATPAPISIPALPLVISVAAGGAHSVALLVDRSVATWGDGQQGQLGHGNNLSLSTPTVISGLDNVKAISAGATHTLVVRQDGTVWAWGDNSYGQLGNGTTLASNTPALVHGLAGVEVAAVAAGDGYSMALTRSGAVYTWGKNNDGQLGNGSYLNSLIPVQVTALNAYGSSTSAISAGGKHCVVIQYSGFVYSWGAGQGGELGDGLMQGSSTPVRIHNLASVQEIAAGGGHTLARQYDFRLITWGKGDSGQLATGNTECGPNPIYLFRYTAGRPVSVEVSSSNPYPVAGQTITLEFVVKTESGYPCQSFNGDWNVTVSGVQAALDETYGTYGGTALSATHEKGGQLLTHFYHGRASVSLTLNNAGDQHLRFSVDHVENPNADIHISPMPGELAYLSLGNRLQPPLANNCPFMRQPILFLLDEHYNLCTWDSSTVATARKAGVGQWQLTGQTSVTAQVGIFLFEDLGVTGATGGTELGLIIDVPGFYPLYTSTVTMPAQLLPLTGVAMDNRCPIAGEATELALAALNLQGAPDTGFDGHKDVVISGVVPSPSGSYGSLGQTQLTAEAAGAGQTVRLEFVDGVAITSLTLHAAAAHDLKFGIVGTLGPVQIRVSSIIAAPSHLRLYQDIQSPVIDGGLFGLQPALVVTDDYGNICPAYQGQVTATALGTDWTLTGTTIKPAIDGLVQFSDLGALSSRPGIEAQISFSLAGFAPANTAQVALPAPGRLSVVQPAIAAGVTHCLALSNHGLVYAWGRNDFGQLGNGTTIDSLAPVVVQGLSGVTAIAAGDGFSLALSGDGRVYAWGQNSLGQLGSGGGDQHLPVEVPGLRGVKAIAAGGTHAVALLHDGTVLSWGSNSHGQIGGGSPETTVYGPTPVFTCAQGISAIAAGHEHTVVLCADGTVVTWGSNLAGQLGNGTWDSSNQPVSVAGLPEIVAIAAGMTHTMAVDRDGILHAWGSNVYGQLGDGGWYNQSYPTLVRDLQDAQVISASNHSLTVRDGTAYAWGENWSGQLGIGPGTNTNTPAAVIGTDDVVAVAAGVAHTVFMTSEGAVLTCGTLVSDAASLVKPNGILLSRMYGDFDGNGQVNLLDLAGVARAYGWYGTELFAADINSDGCADLFDLVIVAQRLSA